MRSRLLGAAPRCLALALTVSGLSVACTIEPPAGTLPPPLSGVLECRPRDAPLRRPRHEGKFGRTGPEVVNNPQRRDKIRQMFGADWQPGGKLVRGAMPFLERTGPPRGVRIGDPNTGRVPG